eukprot:1158689-Pelagomonas_calceolata.AAC.14
MSLLQQLGREQLGSATASKPLRSHTRSLALLSRNVSKRRGVISGATSSRLPNIPSSIKDIRELKLLDSEDAGGDLLDPEKMRNVKVGMHSSEWAGFLHFLGHQRVLSNFVGSAVIRA